MIINHLSDKFEVISWNTQSSLASLTLRAIYYIYYLNKKQELKTFKGCPFKQNVLFNKRQYVCISILFFKSVSSVQLSQHKFLLWSYCVKGQFHKVSIWKNSNSDKWIICPCMMVTNINQVVYLSQGLKWAVAVQGSPAVVRDAHTQTLAGTD